MNQLKKCTAIKSLLLLASMCVAALACAAPVVGTVTHLSGPLLAQKADGKMRVLGARSAVETGDTLSTQNRGYAQIKFGDDSVLILQPDTIVTINKFSYEAGKPAADSIAFTLVQGGLRSNAGLVGKRSKDSVQLATPSANISMQAANVVVQYIKPSAEAVAVTRTAYLLASTAALDASLMPTRSDMPMAAAIQPLMLAQGLPPVPTAARPPGLYVQVLDGLIHVTNPAGTSNFAAGQFGYTPSIRQPPVMVPTNPGIQFTPPPTFTQSTGPSATTTPAKSNAVDCEVR